MPATTLNVLAFASAALAIPHAQWQPFRRHAHPNHNGPPGYGYGSESESASASASSAAAYSPPATYTPVGTGTGAPYPYPSGNATGIYGSTGYGTGTGYPTSYSASYTPSVYPSAPYPSSGPSPVGPETSSVSVASYPTEGSCPTDVTVTTTEKTTVYVTAGSYSSSSEVSPVSQSTVHVTSTYTAPASYSSAAPYSSSSPVVYSYSAVSSSSSSEASPVTPSSSYVAPAPYSSSSPVVSYSAPAPTSSSVYVAPTSYSSSSSAAPAPTSYSNGFRGKRGLAYNDAGLTDCLTDSTHVGWAYNWGSDASGFSNEGIEFIPTLWGPSDDFTGSWTANANAAIASGSQYLFGFNEADNPGQANLTPEEAASAWKQYMEPFAGKAKLVAPSVTNGGGSMGLDWLCAFLEACSDCTIDAVNQHWYDSTSNDVDYFKNQISNATTVSGKPVFVSEFAGIGSDSDISSFLQDVMPWMDNNDNVLGYAYFMVSDGLLVSGSEPSGYGSTYATY